MMNHKERVQAVLSGQTPDRVPLSFWLHDFSKEGTAQDLADETLRLYETFEFDFLKPQFRAHCFGETWGLELAPAGGPSDWPVVRHYPLQTQEDLDKVRAVPPGPALQEQIESIRLLRQRLDSAVPVVATVFSPMMNIAFMQERGLEGALDLMRQAPDMLEQALHAMTETLCDFTDQALQAGCDGIFYATITCNRGQMSRDEYDRFHAPFDAEIEKAASAGWLNILHLCGPDIMVDWFLESDFPIMSWATTPGNPTLTQMAALTGKVVLGGAPGKPAFGAMSAHEIQRHVQASLAETGGRRHMLGPDCSINPGCPDPLIRAAVDAARSYTPDP